MLDFYGQSYNILLKKFDLFDLKLMRKFWILILAVFVTLLSSQTFWYLESKVFCLLENKNVTIFMKNEEWTVKCKTYMDAIYQSAIKKYNEVLTISSYIDQWEDVYYWTKVLEEKKAEFLQLVNYRAQIKKAIDKFEMAIFDKYYDALQNYMKVYYSDLETEYYILINQDYDKRARNYNIKIEQLGQQMWNVTHVLNATKLDDIMDVMSSYLYLKQQLRWR